MLSLSSLRIMGLFKYGTVCKPPSRVEAACCPADEASG